jgi:hypothetical protein
MRLLLAGIAALSVLAASSAEARPWAAYHCGKDKIAWLPMKYFLHPDCGYALCDGKEHYFDMKKDPNNKRPLPSRWFRDFSEKGGDLFYKGKKCREFTEDDYNRLP